jgi:hypothetical protein
VTEGGVPDDSGTEWVTVGEAGRRLDISGRTVAALAEGEGIEVRRRGRQPGVNWQSVEAFIARSRITGPIESVTRHLDRSDLPSGVAKMDSVRERFGWSDHDLADALGVDWSQVSRYRVYGVPDRHVSRLRRLSLMAVNEVAPPRRRSRESR